MYSEREGRNSFTTVGAFLSLTVPKSAFVLYWKSNIDTSKRIQREFKEKYLNESQTTQSLVLTHSINVGNTKLTLNL